MNLAHLIEQYITFRKSLGELQQSNAAALRMFGRFLLVRGLAPHNVAAGLPRATRWRVAGLPQRLEQKEIQRLLKVPDRGTPVGRRNRAMLLLLARLGLRARGLGLGLLRALENGTGDWGSRPRRPHWLQSPPCFCRALRIGQCTLLEPRAAQHVELPESDPNLPR